jgi:hypothetical protein
MKCNKCETEIKMSKKEKLQKKMLIQILKPMEALDPMIAVALKEAQDYCYLCWKKRVLETVGPLTMALTGQVMKENNISEQPEKEAIE